MQAIAQLIAFLYALSGLLALNIVSHEPGKGDQWELIFRLPDEVGGNVFLAYAYGNGTESSNECLFLNSKGCVYRSDMIDTWTSYGVWQVRFSLYKGETEAAFIVFDGNGSNNQNWFHPDRILNSSWIDLVGNHFNGFSILGHHARNFYINKLWGGCPNDFGWTMILSGPSEPCAFDKWPRYPKLLFSNSRRGTRPDPHGYDVADELAIYVMRG